MYDCAAASMRHRRSLRNVGQLLLGMKMESFPLAVFSPLSFQQSGAIELNLGFSYTGFYMRIGAGI